MTDAIVPPTPSSAAPAAPSASPPVAAPAAASPTTPASPPTPPATSSAPPAAAAVIAARPEWVPENFFDTEKNEVKGAELRAHLDELATFKAAEDSRKLTLPATPEAYELKLPETFKAPEGITVNLDANDPTFKAAQKWAHEEGLTQTQFSKAVGILATMEAEKTAYIEGLKTQNLASLGAKGPERIDAVTRLIAANGTEAEVKPILATLVTAGHITFFEKIFSKLVNGGNAPFKQTGRVVETGKVDDATYDKMSFSEKKAYAAKHSGQAA